MQRISQLCGSKNIIYQIAMLLNIINCRTTKEVAQKTYAETHLDWSVAKTRRYHEIVEKSDFYKPDDAPEDDSSYLSLSRRGFLGHYLLNSY